MIVGVSGIEASVGLEDVWYNYRISTTVNSSKELGIHQQTPTLYLSNDLTGCPKSARCSWMSHTGTAITDNFFPKCVFCFGRFPELFCQQDFAEMRGVSDKSGHSPFWEGLVNIFPDELF